MLQIQGREHAERCTDYSTHYVILHIGKGGSGPPGPPPPPPLNPPLTDLPTFDQVCQLNHPTLRYIPAKARPAFARALSSSLRDVLQKNAEDAWLKLFMLPKCVLPSLRHKGNHNPHKSIESLCKHVVE